VWTGWAREKGFDPEEVVRAAHGRPSLTTIREYLPDADHQAENRVVEQAEIDDTDGVVPLPGADELLQSLQPGSWTIVTSCTRPLAEVRLRAAGLSIPHDMVTSTDIVHGKPHPEPFLKGAAVLGIAPNECLVAEDAPAGIRSGRAAGARVMAIRTELPDKDLRNAGADWILDNLAAVSVRNLIPPLLLDLKTR